LDCLRAVSHEPAPLQLQQRYCPDKLRLEGRAELRALAQHDLGDRDRVARIGLARPVATTLAMGAPGGHIEHLVTRCRERRDQQTAVARGALHTDDRLGGVEAVEPAAQLPHPFRTVREAERAELAAALVQQRGNVAALVHVDPDDHGVLLSRSCSRGLGRRGTLLCRCSRSGARLLSSHLRRPAHCPPVDESNAGQRKQRSQRVLDMPFA
jgi:hypothetical protein